MSYREINIFARTDEETKANYKLEQTAYIVYMMVGSYFKKCESHNCLLERKLRMMYREMREQAQWGLEARIEKEFLRSCSLNLKALGELRATAFIKKEKDFASVWFRTGFEEVVVLIDAEGKRTWKYVNPEIRKPRQ